MILNKSIKHKKCKKINFGINSFAKVYSSNKNNKLFLIKGKAIIKEVDKFYIKNNKLLESYLTNYKSDYSYSYDRLKRTAKNIRKYIK